MSPALLTALVLLGAAATLAWLRGTRRNRRLASEISRQLEGTLRPLSTEYVNIGGSIGYHFRYALPGPFASARGTFTLSPRHSLLYLPVSRLLGVRDRLFLNLFSERPLRGEGHVVRTTHVRGAAIDGAERMERREVEAGGRRFTLLWRGADLSAELESLLRSLPAPARLVHFCAFPGTGTLFLRTEPDGGAVEADLEALVRSAPSWLAAGPGSSQAS